MKRKSKYSELYEFIENLGYKHDRVIKRKDLFVIKVYINDRWSKFYASIGDTKTVIDELKKDIKEAHDERIRKKKEKEERQKRIEETRKKYQGGYRKAKALNKTKLLEIIATVNKYEKYRWVCKLYLDENDYIVDYEIIENDVEWKLEYGIESFLDGIKGRYDGEKGEKFNKEQWEEEIITGYYIPEDYLDALVQEDFYRSLRHGTPYDLAYHGAEPDLEIEFNLIEEDNKNRR